MCSPPNFFVNIEDAERDKIVLLNQKKYGRREGCIPRNIFYEGTVKSKTKCRKRYYYLLRENRIFSSVSVMLCYVIKIYYTFARNLVLLFDLRYSYTVH